MKSKTEFLIRTMKEKRFAFETNFKVQLSAIVVDEKCRGHGIGKMLIDYAEKWTLQEGFKEIFLYSNIVRKEAHEFYQKNGFINYKNSNNFRKILK